MINTSTVSSSNFISLTIPKSITDKTGISGSFTEYRISQILFFISSFEEDNNILCYLIHFQFKLIYQRDSKINVTIRSPDKLFAKIAFQQE